MNAYESHPRNKNQAWYQHKHVTNTNLKILVLLFPRSSKNDIFYGFTSL